MNFTDIFPDFKVFIGEGPVLPKMTREVEKRIEVIWQEQKILLKDHLFDGKILSCNSLESNQMIGNFVSYKHYIAQTKDPSLQPYLRIKPVGVSGVTFFENKVLIGKRSQTVFHHRGMYELVPSGGVDPSTQEQQEINLKQQLLIELEEEAGIPPKDVLQVNPFGLIIEPLFHTHEICATIHLKSNLNVHSAEYSEMMWLDQTEIASFIEKQRDQILDYSVLLLRKCRFIQH